MGTTSMAYPGIAGRSSLESGGSTQLDELLEEVAAVLQLTPTQYNLAGEHYGAVTRWLAADGSPIAPFNPFLYPQGSMALLTTVRPWRTIEYDLDVVCQLEPTHWGPDGVYEAVYDRLARHSTYGKMLERMKRCIRINYEHEFHLDIIPAEPDHLRGGTCIVIPDLALDGTRVRWQWKTSNPRGYIAWFHARGQTSEMLKAHAIDPMPPRTTVANNTVLATVVQLIKRYRDVQFRGGELAPRSIILTTLAAHAYDGSQSTGVALQQVADGIAAAIYAAAPGRVCVENPTNPAERFCDKFTDESYDAFRDFARRLQRDVAELLSAQGGLPAIRQRLGELFGTDVIEKAINAYGARIGGAKSVGALRASASAGLLISGSGGSSGNGSGRAIGGDDRGIPSHRFFGAA